MQYLTDTTPVVDVSHERGRVRVFQPKPGFLISKIEGHFDGALCDAFVRPFETAPMDQRFVSFHDWRDMTGFDPLLPARLVSFTLGFLMRTDRVVISTRSALVAMAVRAGNLTLKRIELVEPEAFEAALRAAYPR